MKKHSQFTFSFSQRFINRALYIVHCTFFFFLSNVSFSQYSFQRNDSIKVQENSQWLTNPWVGGLNNPQFSAIDLDGDGKKDLFIHDRSSDRIFTFINKGQPGEVKYIYDSQYESKFPPLHNWVLLVDYDMDGKEDIFTSDTSNFQVGVAVYRNEPDANGIHFKRVSTPLLTADGNHIYISEWDIPAITDIDSDGDVDIATFDIAGSYVLLFRNLSKETYGHSDSLCFTLHDQCWGHFAENFGNCTTTLGDTICPSPMIVKNGGKENSPLGGGEHAGSTILALDINGDKAKELLIGDITCNSMYLLVNGGDSLNARFKSVYHTYPSPDSIWIYYFPAAFYLDVNNDSVKDLIIAPNALNISEYFRGCWYFKNEGTNDIPQFVFQKKSFLQDEMIEVSQNSFPVFFDYNDDGLADLLISNYNYFAPTGYKPSGIALYENIGTLSAPEFKLITRDFAGISTMGSLQGVYPAFGDLDNDGDEDMIIGDASGHLHYFENTAGKGNPANFILKQANYIKVNGQNAAPQLVDLNRDGKLDLVVGKKNGTLSYYKNAGTSSVANFQLATDSLGKVDVKKKGSITGFSIPFLTELNDSCHFNLFVGSESGQIFLYSNIDNNLAGAFTLVDTNFSSIYPGKNSSISGADINGDSTVDLVVGNIGGGVSLFMNKGMAASGCHISDTIPPAKPPFTIDISPIPAYGSLNISVTDTTAGELFEVTLYNMLGQQCYYHQFQSSGTKTIVTISILDFSSGIYYCNVNAVKGQQSQKIIIVK